MDDATIRDASDDLAARYLETALAIARSKARGEYRRWLEEFESAACFGLATAIRQYDPSRGPFEKFAVHKMYFAIADVMRTHFTGACRGRPDHGREVSLSAIDGGSDVEFEDVLIDDAPPVGWEMEWEETVEWVAARSPGSASQREIVRRRFLRADLASQRLAAESIGVSQTCASFALKSLRRIGRVVQRESVA